MSGFVLVRTSDGKYVAPPGQERSYTERLEDARVFASREMAERERCVDSEYVRSLESLLEGRERS